MAEKDPQTVERFAERFDVDEETAEELIELREESRLATRLEMD